MKIDPVGGLFNWFQYFAIKNNAIANKSVNVISCMCKCTVPVGWILRRAIAMPKNKYIYSSNRYCQVALHCDCTNLHFQQQYIRVLVFPDTFEVCYYKT